MEIDETKETNTSDDALNQAAEQATEESHESEETVSETQETQEIQDKGETDQQFRSGLGRRVSKMERTMNGFIQEMRLSMHNMTAQGNRTPETTSSDGGLVETVSDVRKIIQQYETEQTQKIKGYENTYLNHLARLGVDEELDGKDFKRLEDLTKTSFNQSYSAYQDPIADAERNFLKAMRVIDKEKTTTPKKEINLKGDTPKSTGVSSGAKTVDESKPIVKLDKYAQEFVNYHNIPEDKVHKALSGNTPERLKKK